MRLGILGGTFDPVHYGHLLLAERCREECRLDQVWFVPAGVPPHKQAQQLTPGVQRAEMLEFAVAGIPEFKVSRCEIQRSGPSYTVETLRELRHVRPGDELFFLVGADSLIELPTWREPREIAELASLIVVRRGSQPAPELESLVPHLGTEAVSRIQHVEMPAIGLASRDIRARVSAGRSIRFTTPRAVEQYIAEHGLYRPAE
ncbi:MAG TPA: nicotinate-nucleotide adenylyltransferase [Planctomycetaceae bacterium]|nr:nicotinate-nucleotide adenylyltransferase [Planctomycetaceae bacterium]